MILEFLKEAATRFNNFVYAYTNPSLKEFLEDYTQMQSEIRAEQKAAQRARQQQLVLKTVDETDKPLKPSLRSRTPVRNFVQSGSSDDLTSNTSVRRNSPSPRR